MAWESCWNWSHGRPPQCNVSFYDYEILTNSREKKAKPMLRKSDLISYYSQSTKTSHSGLSSWSVNDIIHIFFRLTTITPTIPVKVSPLGYRVDILAPCQRLARSGDLVWAWCTSFDEREARTNVEPRNSQNSRQSDPNASGFRCYAVSLLQQSCNLCCCASIIQTSGRKIDRYDNADDGVNNYDIKKNVAKLLMRIPTLAWNPHQIQLFAPSLSKTWILTDGSLTSKRLDMRTCQAESLSPWSWWTQPCHATSGFVDEQRGWVNYIWNFGPRD